MIYQTPTPDETERIQAEFRRRQKDYQLLVTLPAAVGFAVLMTVLITAMAIPARAPIFNRTFLGLPGWLCLLTGLALVLFSFTTVFRISRCPHCHQGLSADFFDKPRGESRTWFHCPTCDVELRKPESKRRKP